MEFKSSSTGRLTILTSVGTGYIYRRTPSGSPTTREWHCLLLQSPRASRGGLIP